MDVGSLKNRLKVATNYEIHEMLERSSKHVMWIVFCSGVLSHPKRWQKQIKLAACELLESVKSLAFIKLCILMILCFEIRLWIVSETETFHKHSKIDSRLLAARGIIFWTFIKKLINVLNGSLDGWKHNPKGCDSRLWQITGFHDIISSNMNYII